MRRFPQVVFALALLLSAAAYAQDREVVRPEQLELNVMGYCGDIDMRTVWFLRDDNIIQDGRQLRIRREALLVRVGDTTHVNEIGYSLSDGVMDIQLSFVVVDGELALHWRETYLHRQYRQGLFHIVGTRAEPWCEGLGGFTSSH